LGCRETRRPAGPGSLGTRGARMADTVGAASDRI
jgi:hypothetical protein